MHRRDAKTIATVLMLGTVAAGIAVRRVRARTGSWQGAPIRRALTLGRREASLPDPTEPPASQVDNRPAWQRSG